MAVAASRLGWSERRMELLEKAAKGLGVRRERPAAGEPTAELAGACRHTLDVGLSERD